MRRIGWMVFILVDVVTVPVRAMDFSGRYTFPTPEGSAVLTLEQTDGAVVGSLNVAGRACEVLGRYAEDDEEAFIEGTISCMGAAGGEFEFSRDDEDETFYLFLTPRDAAGVLRLDLATLYAAAFDSVGDPVPNPPATSGSPLVGVWATQVIMNTPDGGMATQLFMDIRADGTLLDLGSRSMGGTSDVNGDTGFVRGGDVADWRVERDVLFVRMDGSPWVSLARFEVSGDRLLLTYYDGDRKLWYRQ